MDERILKCCEEPHTTKEAGLIEKEMMLRDLILGINDAVCSLMKTILGDAPDGIVTDGPGSLLNNIDINIENARTVLKRITELREKF